jgi:hypothetical protein
MLKPFSFIVVPLLMLLKSLKWLAIVFGIKYVIKWDLLDLLDDFLD